MTDPNAVMYPDLPEPLRDAAIHAHRQLHIAWTKAVGTQDYNKEDFRQLEKAIDDLVALAQKASS